MEIFKKLEADNRVLYSDKFFSGNYNQLIYLKKSNDDGSNKPKFYISVFTYLEQTLVLQGYIYFYIDFAQRRSDFIGLAVVPEYRNLNISSLLISNWIDICLNNGIEFLGTHYKQKKPFLIYLLKKYGFEVEDLNLYKTSDALISLYRSLDFDDKTKFLLFKSKKHEKSFETTNIYKTDNYLIIHNTNNLEKLDDVIIPIQNMTLLKLTYELMDKTLATEKASQVLFKHKK